MSLCVSGPTCSQSVTLVIHSLLLETEEKVLSVLTAVASKKVRKPETLCCLLID